VARGRISRFLIDLRRRPYNTLALPCECVIMADSAVMNINEAALVYPGVFNFVELWD